MTILVLCAALLALAVGWYGFEKSRRRTHPVKGGLQPEITLPHEAEFELYGNAFSHCSRKTRIVMAELGIGYVHKAIDLIETGSYQTLSPAYLKVNPSGLIPTLVHRGHPVYESDDILSYAVAHAGPNAPRLVPEDAALRAKMQSWIDFCNLSSNAPTADMEQRLGACVPALTLPLFMTAIRYIPLRRILFGLLFHPDKARPIFFSMSKVFGLKRMLSIRPIRQMIANGRAFTARHLQRLNDELAQSNGPWILGREYSLADITLSCVLFRLDETGFLNQFVDKGGFSHVRSYYERLRARPGWDAAISRVTHPIIEQAVNDLRLAREQDAGVRRTLIGE